MRDHSNIVQLNTILFMSSFNTYLIVSVLKCILQRRKAGRKYYIELKSSTGSFSRTDVPGSYQFLIMDLSNKIHINFSSLGSVFFQLLSWRRAVAGRKRVKKISSMGRSTQDSRCSTVQCSVYWLPLTPNPIAFPSSC